MTETTEQGMNPDLKTLKAIKEMVEKAVRGEYERQGRKFTGDVVAYRLRARANRKSKGL